jgi:hypothetical protein
MCVFSVLIETLSSREISAADGLDSRALCRRSCAIRQSRLPNLDRTTTFR